MSLIQCVPNFSEGRNQVVIDALVHAAQGDGVRLADWSADVDHHRCVLTLLGCAASLEAASLRMARVAVGRIDLRKHRGVHPRMGALDVLPFVPLTDTGATMAECVELANRVGRRLADELSLPVFLYEEAATTARRLNLAKVRGVGFEALRASGLTGERAPDYGPDQVHKTAGAVAVGARGPLIAFNVWLETEDVEIAKEIAACVREANGGLPGVKALGLALASPGCVQVSMNLTRPAQTSLLAAFTAVKREAELRGVQVRRSEVIGCCRLEDALGPLRDALQAPEFKCNQILDPAAAALLGAQWPEG